MRYMVDCRNQPSESNCSLAMTGEHDELLEAAVQHVTTVHGHADSPELRAMIEADLQPDATPVG